MSLKHVLTNSFFKRKTEKNFKNTNTSKHKLCNTNQNFITVAKKAIDETKPDNQTFM